MRECGCVNECVRACVNECVSEWVKSGMQDRVSNSRCLQQDTAAGRRPGLPTTHTLATVIIAVMLCMGQVNKKTTTSPGKACGALTMVKVTATSSSNSCATEE